MQLLRRPAICSPMVTLPWLQWVVSLKRFVAFEALKAIVQWRCFQASFMEIWGFQDICKGAQNDTSVRNLSLLRPIGLPLLTRFLGNSSGLQQYFYGRLYLEFVLGQDGHSVEIVHLCEAKLQLWDWNVSSLKPTASMTCHVSEPFPMPKVSMVGRIQGLVKTWFGAVFTPFFSIQISLHIKVSCSQKLLTQRDQASFQADDSDDAACQSVGSFAVLGEANAKATSRLLCATCRMDGQKHWGRKLGWFFGRLYYSIAWKPGLKGVYNPHKWKSRMAKPHGQILKSFVTPQCQPRALVEVVFPQTFRAASNNWFYGMYWWYGSPVSHIRLVPTTTISWFLYTLSKLSERRAGLRNVLCPSKSRSAENSQVSQRMNYLPWCPTAMTSGRSTLKLQQVWTLLHACPDLWLHAMKKPRWTCAYTTSSSMAPFREKRVQQFVESVVCRPTNQTSTSFKMPCLLPFLKHSQFNG